MIDQEFQNGQKISALIVVTQEAQLEEAAASPEHLEEAVSTANHAEEPTASIGKKSVGRPAGSRTAQLTLLMDPALKKVLQFDALERSVSAAHVVDEALREYYRARGKEL